VDRRDNRLLFMGEMCIVYRVDVRMLSEHPDGFKR